VSGKTGYPVVFAGLTDADHIIVSFLVVVMLAAADEEEAEDRLMLTAGYKRGRLPN
jgi:hypothetical protein